MGMGASVTVGFKYYLGLHIGLGRGPLNELVQIRIDGKDAFKGSVTGSGQIVIDKPDLFGGKMKEGGIQGPLEVLMGEPTQTAPAGLVSMLGGEVPGFRGMATLFFDGLVSAMTPYLKPWKIRVRRTTAGWDGEAWYPEKATVVLAEEGGEIHAMNGAHIVYECLTNREWGGGMDRSRLDDASFRAAADRLYAEGFGLCLRWARQDSVGSFVQSVLDHFAADLYLSRFDGTWHLRLIRDDYDAESLPLFDEDSGLLGIDEDDNGARSGTANELVVKWHDPIEDEDRQWRERNLAAVQSDGQVLSTSLDYPGLPTVELAGRVAVRELRTRAGSLKRFKVRLDRRGYTLEPGQPFRIRSLKRGIETLVLRAGRIEDGTLDSAEITVTAVQDVFGLPDSRMAAVQPSGWIAPDRAPAAVTARRLVERTWRDLAMATDPANLQLIDSTACYIAALAAKPTGLSLGYALETRVGTAAWTERDDSGGFCPSGLLTAALGPQDTAFALSGGIDLDFVEAGGAALLDDEIVRIDAFDPETLTGTMARGCVDTVPASHVAGARLWFLDEDRGLDPTAYAPGVAVQARLLTQAGDGQLEPALAPVDSLTTAQRQERPYPPGQFKLGGASYPASITGIMTLTWAHRDRLLQADQLIDTAQGSIGPESGTTYSARLLRADTQAVLASQTGIAGTTVELSAPYEGAAIVELWSVRAGLDSLQRWRHSLTYIGDLTVSLLHFDGADGSTTFSDAKGKVWTAYSGAAITTAVSKFGGASGRFNASGYLGTPAHADFNFGTGDWTVDVWVRLRSLTKTYGTVLGSAKSSFSAGCRFIMIPSSLGGKVTVGGFDARTGSGAYDASGNPLLTSTTALTVGTFQHIEVSKQGNTLRLFVNGNLEASATSTAAWDFSPSGTQIGANGWDGLNSRLDADLDELRVRKGEAVHTSNFTPPTAPYS